MCILYNKSTERSIQTIQILAFLVFDEYAMRAWAHMGVKCAKTHPITALLPFGKMHKSKAKLLLLARARKVTRRFFARFTGTVKEDTLHTQEIKP